jgi:hypothetical protein
LYRLKRIGRHDFATTFWQIIPDYSRANILRRVMEVSKRLNLPPWAYNDSANFLYISSQLEKDLIHEENLRLAYAAQGNLPKKPVVTAPRKR